MAVVGVVAAVANRHLRHHPATREARRMPPARLARARSRMAATMVTQTGMTAMIPIGTDAIAEQDPQVEAHRLAPRKGRR